MTSITVSGKTYEIEFGYNSFCDTDLFDRVKDMVSILRGDETDDDLAGIGKISEMFKLVRDLLFVGFRKHNPVESLQEVGDLLDEYRKEDPEDEDRSLIGIFGTVSNELVNEGFLSGVLKQMSQASQPTRGKKGPKAVK